MKITWEQAKKLLIVDPRSGLVVPHVAACDPQAGWVETYSTMPCSPEAGMEMSVFTKNEKGEKVEEKFIYTFISCTDPITGRRYYDSRAHYFAFDVVHKDTGEVMHEVAGGPVPEKILKPWIRAAETRSIVAGVPGYLPPDETLRGPCPLNSKCVGAPGHTGECAGDFGKSLTSSPRDCSSPPQSLEAPSPAPGVEGSGQG